MSLPEIPKEIPNENVAKKGIKHIDTVVTGVILGGIIASIYGVKKLRDKEKPHEEIPHDIHMTPPVNVIERPGFWRRLFGRK